MQQVRSSHPPSLTTLLHQVRWCRHDFADHFFTRGGCPTVLNESTHRGLGLFDVLRITSPIRGIDGPAWVACCMFGRAFELLLTLALSRPRSGCGADNKALV